jgi:hypothetical protein
MKQWAACILILFLFPCLVDADWSGIHEVAVSGNYAYVCGNEGLQIINIADPYSPTLAGSYEMMGRMLEGVAVSGNYAYVCENLHGYEGLRIINVANPYSPTLAGFIPNQA